MSKKAVFSYPTNEPFVFAGVEQDFRNAKVALLPVPYSSTTYWDSNTKYGPQALIDASRKMELYDLEFKCDISEEVGIYTLPELQVSKNSPEETTNLIQSAITEILDSRKFPLMIGGEHSITLGAVRAVLQKYKSLTVLQIDAHTDLRDEFEGTKFHHGTVGRRVLEEGCNLVQVGIRSVSEEEIEFIKKTKREKNILYAQDLQVKQVVRKVTGDVYITFDVDALDPSVMPSTGTPEPGGITWYDALFLLREVAKRANIVGADIVELSPKPGIPAPDFLAAKLAYKLIGYSHLL